MVIKFVNATITPCTVLAQVTTNSVTKCSIKIVAGCVKRFVVIHGQLVLNCYKVGRVNSCSDVSKNNHQELKNSVAEN